MSRAGAPTRAEGLATLHRLAHELFVRDEDKAWIQLGDHNGKAEPREAPAK